MSGKKKKRSKSPPKKRKQDAPVGEEADSSIVPLADGSYSRAPRNPVLRYGMTVLLVMLGFYGLYWSESLVEQRWFRPILEIQTEVTRWLLLILQQEVERSGNVLISAANQLKPFTLAVGLGCEAFDVTILAMVGILCFPVSWKLRIVGACCAGVIVQAINVVRLTSLFLIGIYKPEYFDFLHYNLWQVLLVLCVIGVWWLWLMIIRIKSTT